MGEVIKQLNDLTGGEAIIVTDVGQHQMVACRYARFTKSKSNITSGGPGVPWGSSRSDRRGPWRSYAEHHCDHRRWRLPDDAPGELEQTIMQFKPA